MKKTKVFFRFLVFVLLIAATLTSTACAPTYNPTEANIVSRTELGEGAKTIVFLAVDKNNEAAMFTIHTDATYLSEVLLAHNLVEGEDGPYGLMIHTVNGEKADYNVDGSYWAVWEEDAYSNYGVSSLEIKDGGCYSLVYTVYTAV